MYEHLQNTMLRSLCFSLKCFASLCWLYHVLLFSTEELRLRSVVIFSELPSNFTNVTLFISISPCSSI